MTARASGDKVLADLLDSAIEAKAHYQIWWALANQARPRLVKSMNRFPDFFVATQRAHFDSMIIHLAHLFDKQHRASSIESYLRLSNIGVPATDVSSLKGELTPLAPVVRAVREIRHNVVAHKNAGLTERQVFKNAGVTPNQVRDLIISSVAIVETLRRAKAWNGGVFQSDRFARSTLGLIEALKG